MTADTKGCASTGPAPRQRLVCEYDSQPCEVAEVIPGGLTEEEREESADLLPCASCRSLTHHAGNLRGLRLGRHGREVLLTAPPPDAEDAMPMAPNGSRAARSAVARSLRRLHDAGLVRQGRAGWETSVRPSVPHQFTFRQYPFDHQFDRWDRRRERGDDELVLHDGEARHTVKRWRSRPGHKARRWVAAARLTPLGVAVVESHRDQLESGRPVRWDLERALAAAEQLRDPPVVLVGRWRDAIEARREATAALVRGAMMGDPDAAKGIFMGPLRVLGNLRMAIDASRLGQRTEVAV